MIKLMITLACFKSALKYTSYNSLVLIECYEIVNRGKNEVKKDGGEE